MVKTIIREYHWTPDIIDKLFVDDIDYHGIIWHYNDIKEVNEEIQKSIKKKK